MRRVRFAVVVLALIAVSAVPQPTSAATAIIETGWWSSSPFSAAPEGGLVVGRAPSGTTGVSAIRLELGAGISSAALSIPEDGGFAQELAAIAVCRGTDDWSAVANGPLEAAPEPQCAETPPLMVREDGRWTADLKAVLGSATGRVTVMLVPGTSSDPGGALGLGWEVQLDRPSFQATEVPGPTPPTAPRGAPGPGTPSATPTPPAGSARPVPSAGAPATATTAPTATSTTAPAPQPGLADAPPTRPLLAPGGEEEGRPWGRLGGFVLLAAFAGAVAGGSRWLITSGALTRLRIPFVRR